VILCLDVGNSQIYGGVYENDSIRLRFRMNSKGSFSSDEVGIFLRGVLRENDIDPKVIEKIAICSVVPDSIYTIRNCCFKYFDNNPFILKAGVKTGLKIKYRNPIEVGADRIANAICAIHEWPNQNAIIIDFGTATTFCAVSKEKDYLGGVIIPGLRISMEALEARTAKLPKVEIVKPETVTGRSTVESIQSGLYYSHLASVRMVTERMTEESFKGEKPLIVGTGGFAGLFEEEGIFDHIKPDLVLNGLYQALKMNS
jgi:type III pantothenate kinase